MRNNAIYLLLMVILPLMSNAQTPIDVYNIGHNNPNCQLSPTERVAVYNEGKMRGSGVRNYLRPNYEYLCQQVTGYQWGPTYTDELVFINIQYSSSSSVAMYANLMGGGGGWLVSDFFVPQTLHHFDWAITGGGVLSVNENILTSYVVSDAMFTNNLQNIYDGNFPPYDIQCPSYKAALLDGFIAGVYGLSVSP